MSHMRRFHGLRRRERADSALSMVLCVDVLRAWLTSPTEKHKGVASGLYPGEPCGGDEIHSRRRPGRIRSSSGEGEPQRRVLTDKEERCKLHWILSPLHEHRPPNEGQTHHTLSGSLIPSRPSTARYHGCSEHHGVPRLSQNVIVPTLEKKAALSVHQIRSQSSERNGTRLVGHQS